MGPSPRLARAGIPSFEAKLENEEEVLDAIVSALSKGTLDPGTWTELHEAAVRDDRVSELAFAYESAAQSRKLKTFAPAVQAELLFRAATFFGDVLGDEIGATTYLERALTASPAHVGAFERIDAQLTRTNDAKKLAELSVHAAAHRAKPEQIELLRRAATLFEQASLDDKAIETYQQLLRIDPRDEDVRNALEARFVRASRYRDVVRLLEHALATEPGPSAEEAARIRQKLIEAFANQLKEPERAMPHVEALLEVDPTNAEARRVGSRLLESKGLAARAAAALAPGAETTEERARYLGVELEHTRGPKRRDVLRRIGIMKQDELGDDAGAFEAYEQALGLDPTDDELRQRYMALGIATKGPLEVARTFSRVSTVAKDAAVRSRITAEIGDLLLRGGDTKRARVTLSGVLASPAADAGAVLTAARALSHVYETENDVQNLVDVLGRIGQLSPLEGEKQHANERIAEICTNQLGDIDRAIEAWRRLVDSPARSRALDALLPLYEQREAWFDLAYALEERAKDTTETSAARALLYRAAEVLTTNAKDVAAASEAWRKLVAAYGPARDIYAQWVPLLEQQRLWPELAEALGNDATLAADTERAAILARLGTVHLQRTRIVHLAIEAFARALEVDAGEKTSRATLEKLFLVAEHRLAAAAILEPIYRREQNAHDLLRVLDIRGAAAEDIGERLAALDEAARIAESTSQDKVVELVGRGLAEAVHGGQPIAAWMTRFRAVAESADAKRRAEYLMHALGERVVESPDLLALALFAGEESAAAGDVSSALVAYRRALAFEPSSSEILARVDELLQEQGNPEERVALYRAALERGPDAQRRRQLLHNIGTIERTELRNAQAAIGAFRRALLDDPADRIANAALVELYAETEQWDEVCDLLDDYLEHSTSPEENRAARAQLAQIAAVHGQPERGAHHASLLLQETELAETELDLVEQVALHIEHLPLLRGVLERRVHDSADPRVQVECLARLADLGQQTGEVGYAVERLRQAADVAQGMGDDETAVVLYDRLRALTPSDEHATSQLVEIHERTGNWQAVRPLYTVLLDLTNDTPTRIGLLRRLSRTLADHLADAAGAFVAARSAFALAPTDRDVLAEATALSIRVGQTEGFAATISDVLASSPELPELTKAELALAKARLLATNETTWNDSATTFRSILQTANDESVESRALQSFEELLRSMPASDARTRDVRWLNGWRVERASADGRVLALLAWAESEERELGSARDALDVYKKVLAVDEANLDALAAVSRLSLAQGDIDGALSALLARRAASEGDVKNALDVQIATILATRPERAGEALDRVAEVLENSPQDHAAIAIAAQLLGNPEVGARASKVLESSLDAIEDPNQKVAVFDQLIVASEPGQALYSRYIETLAELGRNDSAYEVALRSVRTLPAEASLWDRAEQLARQLEAAQPLADTYDEVLRSAADGKAPAGFGKAEAMELGMRAVAFYEEWYEDGESVVRILERLLTIDPQDTWAFDRLKLIFDANERWDELFALYDRSAAAADRERKLELLEEAAQIAKDFANHSKRAIGYFEQLLELRPGNARLTSALERLYERHGCHRELITLRGLRIGALPPDEAQRERGRIAALWLDELNDTSSALIVVEDIVANQGVKDVGGQPIIIDVTSLLERVLTSADHANEIRESVPPPATGRRDSYLPIAPTRGLVRQRAAALLEERYRAPGNEADLARVLEVELEVVSDREERIARHREIASLHARLGNDDAALGHYVELVLLDPETPEHRRELELLAERTDQFVRLADVLVRAADASRSDALVVELLMSAAEITAEKLADNDRAIDLLFRVVGTKEEPSRIPEEMLLRPLRRIEVLLEKVERSSERLDVLERLAVLENDPEVQWHVLGEAARLAMGIDDDERAIWAWEGRLRAKSGDAEALDGLAFLFERLERWQPLIETLTSRSQRVDRDAEQRRADLVRAAEIAAEKLDATRFAIETWQTIETSFGHSDEGTRALATLYRETEQWGSLAELLAGAASRTESASEKSALLCELGDVRRLRLVEAEPAIQSYEQSLESDPRTEGARSGLRAFLTTAEHRAEVARILLAAYVAADDWQLILGLTEHRLEATDDVDAQIAVLLSAAKISEERAEDAGAAFSLVRRALLLAPQREATATELFRLAELTRAWRPLADALAECIAEQDAEEEYDEAAWVGTLRFRMGVVLEMELEEADAALDAYVRVARREPDNLDAARAVVRVGGKAGRWDAAAGVVVAFTRAKGTVERELVDGVETAALEHGGWDAVTSELAARIADEADLAPALARDLEAVVAGWHRDRRGDPDAAEAGYTRALAHDATNAPLLADLAQLQRRVRGRPLVESLLRLSETTGGDLDLLGEAAEVAVNSIGDRALARSINERLLALASERWEGTSSSNAPEGYVERASRELVRIHGEDGDHDKVVALLISTSSLPWPVEKARSLRHEAACVAIDKLHDSERAIGIYLELIAEDPHDTEAVGGLVALYESGGQSQELLALKRRLVGTARNLDERIASRLEVASLEDNLGNVSGAIAILRENLTEAPRSAATVSMLAALLRAQGDAATLEELLASQAELAESDLDATASAEFSWQAARVAEIELQDLPRAIEHLRRAIAHEERPAAFDTLAELSTRAGAHDDAAGFLDRLRDLTAGKERAAVTLRLADALVASSRSSEARERLESEIGRDPEADAVRERLAATYRAAQDWNALAETLSAGAYHAPDKVIRLARLTEAAQLHRTRTGDPEKAIPLLEQAADLAPEDNALKLGLADVLGAAGRFDDARTLLRALIDAFGGRRPKERAPVHYHLARLDLAVGDRARALVELDAATRIDPANAEILRALAELARDDGQLERAERSYRALLTVLRRQEDPTEDAAITRSEALFELAQIAKQQGESERATEILESAFELATANAVEARRLEGALGRAEDHVNLARALGSRLERGGADDEASLRAQLARLFAEHLDRKDEALDMALRAIDLDPKSDSAHKTALEISTTTGKTADYETRIRALAESHAGEDSALAGVLFLRLARITETAHGNDAEAAVLYERAAESRPEDRELLVSLALVYERLGDDSNQARVLGKCVELDTEAGGAAPDALYRLARLHFRTGDVDAGCDVFERAFDADPDADRAEELLRTAAEKHPDAERIVDLYERLARAPGRERSLVDALVRRWAIGGSTDAMKEAVELADKLEDPELAESLLRRYLERDHTDTEGRVWALGLLAWRCEEAGRFREAAVLKREAAEIAEPESARRFLFEVAGLAAGPLEDLRLAATIFEELHEKDAQDRDAWEMLLDVYRRLDEYSKFVELVSRVAELIDDVGERSKLRLESVKLQMQKLKLPSEEAAQALREIVDSDPAQVDAALLLVNIYEENGQEEELAELLARQLDGAKDRQDADAVSSLSLRLGQLIEKRDRGQARDIYYAGLDWAPQAREILLVLERIHTEDGEVDARAEVMERRLAIESGAAAEALALALYALRVSLEDNAAALRVLETGFRAAPRSADLRQRLETVYREGSEYRKLAELYVIDANSREDSVERSARLREAARLYRDELRSPADAANVLREARAADPQSADALIELVDTLAAAGDLPGAILELTQVIDLLGDDQTIRPDLVGRRALLRSRSNDMEGALHDFEDSLGKSSHDLRSDLAEHLGKMAMHAAGRGDAAQWRAYRLRIAELRIELGDIGEARNVLTELLKTDSKDKATLRAIAYVDELEGRWDSASATYRRLVGLEDNEGIAAAALKLLEACEKAGRLADARGGLERARLAAPGDAVLRERLAWLYEQLGALKELAELVLEEARAAGDVGPRFDGLLRAGQLFLEAGASATSTQQLVNAAAIPPLEEAHALRPADLDCTALLSDAYVSGGRLEEAQDILLRTIAGFKGRRARELSAFYHRLARIAEVAGDRTAELQHLTTALDMDAQNGNVAAELSYLAMELGNLEVAQRALRQVTMLKAPGPLSKGLAYQHLGEIARQQGDVRKAIMLVKRATDEEPTLDSARLLLDQLQSET